MKIKFNLIEFLYALQKEGFSDEEILKIAYHLAEVEEYYES
jgi:hypothetical protein